MCELETTLFGSGITSFRIIGARFETEGELTAVSPSIGTPAGPLERSPRREFGALREPVGTTRPAAAGGRNGLDRSDHRPRRNRRRPRARARGAAAPRAVRSHRRRTRPGSAFRAAHAAPAGEPRAARAPGALDLLVPRQLPGPQEHRVGHRLGELAGERVLLARVEAAEEHRAAVGGFVLSAMRELGPRLYAQ